MVAKLTRSLVLCLVVLVTINTTPLAGQCSIRFSGPVQSASRAAFCASSEMVERVEITGGKAKVYVKTLQDATLIALRNSSAEAYVKQTLVWIPNVREVEFRRFTRDTGEDILLVTAYWRGNRKVLRYPRVRE